MSESNCNHNISDGSADEVMPLLLNAAFLAPLRKVISECVITRDCTVIDDMNFVTYKRYLDGWQGLGELGRLEKQLFASDSIPARHQPGTPWNHLLLC